MDLTQTAFGTWSGGRFMHYGEALDDDRLTALIRKGYEDGVRTFVTADTYGAGKADEVLGRALAEFPRDSYCLVGAIGHDTYKGVRAGSKGYPRFTDPELRPASEYADYIEMATQKSLERCQTDHFDLLLMHNPDEIGYTSEVVWDGLDAVKQKGLTHRLGMAPGPANGFVSDMIHFLEKFGDRIDWSMLILNPMEPWPASLILPTAEKAGVKVMTRVVDFGGLFHGDVLPGHSFKDGDHRNYRPEGWVDHAYEKISVMKEIADRHDLSLLQFACQWTLAQPAVECVIPTMIQEIGDTANLIEDKIADLAALPSELRLTPEEIAQIRDLGDNTGCMKLKGASDRHAELEERLADQWAPRPELVEVAGRHGVDLSW